MARPRKPELNIEIEWNEEHKKALIMQLGRELARMAAWEDEERENGPLGGQSRNGEEPPVPHKPRRRRKVQS